MKQFFLIVIGVAVGSAATWVAVDQNNFISEYRSTETETPNENEISEEPEDIEAKIDQINQLAETHPLELDGNVEELFGNCNPDEERQALDERLICNRKPQKADRFWPKMVVAEQAVLSMLKKRDIKGLMKYTACDAYDLTWYEMHCEADRTSIVEGHFQNLFEYLDAKNFSTLASPKWVRKTPDKRKFRNPRWLYRSRLTLKGFNLQNPWLHSHHPTEHETVILLEQKLGGKVYIVGVPVTGVNGE